MNLYYYKKNYVAPRVVSLERVIETMRDAGKSKGVLAARESLGNLIPEAELDEKLMPPRVLFNYNTYQGIVLLEFSALAGQAEVERVKRKAAEAPQTLAAFTGLDGNSVDILVRFTLPDGNLPVEKEKIGIFHANARRKAIRFYQMQIGEHTPSPLSLFVPNGIGLYVCLTPVNREDVISLPWRWSEGGRSPTGEHRQGSPFVFSLYQLKVHIIMKNNSSLQKFERLEQKQLDTHFVNNLRQGLNCSNFEAKAILNLVYDTYQPYFDNSGSLRPGQILFEVVSIGSPPQIPLSDCKMVTVTLTLDAAEEDLQVRKAGGVISLRQHRMARVTEEAFQQGGLLTVEDLANRLLNCGERTICRDLKDLKDKGIVLPLRSTIKDMGKGITHRAMIVKRWLGGEEYSEIARNTNHDVRSVKNYVDKFKRVVCLALSCYEINSIAFLAKVSPTLAKIYYDLYTSESMQSHRKEELEDIIKKNRY